MPASRCIDDVADEEVAERDLVHRPVLGDEGDDVEGRGRGLLDQDALINEIRRIPGVGRATLYSTERSLRVWIDPDKLRGPSLETRVMMLRVAAEASSTRMPCWRTSAGRRASTAPFSSSRMS
jgi:hypothetical protein